MDSICRIWIICQAGCALCKKISLASARAKPGAVVTEGKATLTDASEKEIVLSKAVLTPLFSTKSVKLSSYQNEVETQTYPSSRRNDKQSDEYLNDQE